MQATLISEGQLIELMDSIWSAMLRLPITPQVEDACDRNAPELTASIDIHGAFNGTVRWLGSEHFARKATALMLEVSEGSLSASEINDAMAELCNIVGGAAKCLLPSPSTLSMPRISHNSHSDNALCCPEVVADLRFLCEGEPLRVQILGESTFDTPRSND